MFDLKKFRSENKLTQIQLAEYLDVTQGFVSQVEKGARPFPEEYISKILAESKYVVSDSVRGEEKVKVNPLRELDGSLEILAKALETLSDSERTNTKNIQELIAQGREQTNNITKLVDLLCRSGIVPDTISNEEKRESFSERDTDEDTAYNAGSANVG